MSLIEKPVSDLGAARSQLLNEIDRLGDVAQGLEERLGQLIIPATTVNKLADVGQQEAPVRSILAEEIYNRAARVGSIVDRLISLRNSLDL